MSMFSTKRFCCLLMACLSFVCAKRTCAQEHSSLSLKTSPETPQFRESYSISFSASSRAVTLSFPLSGPHAFNLRAEAFKSESLPREAGNVWGVKADWAFRSIPVTASYTYALHLPDSRITPVLGIGLSAHFYRETRQIDSITGLPFYLMHQNLPALSGSTRTQNRLGLKYGAELSVGLRTEINRHIFVLTQGRYRYVNCSAQSLLARDLGPLSIFDFNIDIGFKF